MSKEVIKLIELDDDVDGKTNDYRYNLDKALEHSEIAKSEIEHINESVAIQNPVSTPEGTVTLCAASNSGNSG